MDPIPQIPTIYVASPQIFDIRIPTVRNYAPPVTLDIGFPIVEIPGCVTLHKDNKNHKDNLEVLQGSSLDFTVEGNKEKFENNVRNAINSGRLLWAEKDGNMKYDYVVELLCTNPFKTSNDIDEALEMQIETDADSVIAVMPLEDHHPIRIKKIEDGKIRDFNSTLIEIPESRRQDLKPDAYIRCGSIYSMRRDMLAKGIRYGTEDSRAYILPRERVVNIDEPMDFVIASILMEKENRTYVKELKYEKSL